MVLKGFKSFGKQTQVSLSAGVNGIVGPNGSGKSNIFDSISFVMGEHGSTIRAKKGEDLFYIGKGEKECQVLMMLNNQGKTLEVLRALDADGGSRYSIDGKRVRKEDVSQLFLLANVAPLYSVISQGEIERIVRMSNIQRRKIIDDLAGISEFEEKKEKALMDLELVKSKLSEVTAILQEREKILNRLEADRKAALAYIDLEKSKKRIEAGILFKRVDEMKKVEGSLKTKIIEAEGAISQMKNEIEQLNKDKIIIETELEKLNEKMRVAQGEELLVLVQQLEAKKSKILSEEERIKGSDRSIGFSNERLVELEKSKLDLKSIESVQKELEGVEKQKTDIDAIKERYFGSDKQKYETLKEEFENVRLEVGKKEEQEKLIQEELARIDVRIKTVETESRKMEAERNAAKADLEALVPQKSGLERDLKDLVEFSSLVISKINQIKPGFEKKKRELESLTIDGMRRLSPGVRQVMAAGKANQLEGIVGLVSDLFQCDEKYTAALEVAAGSFLTSIVVDTSDNAAKAIDFLRRGKIGRVSFIPVDKILPKLISAEVNKLSSYPGVVGFASGLAKYDKKLEDVFRFIFGDTLVVADIPMAKKLGIGRARMVTLTGDLCERSGLMVGGYYKPMKSAGNLETEVVNMEAELSKLEADRDQANERIVKLRQTLAEVEIEAEKLKTKAGMENLELKLLRERRADLEKSLNEIGIAEIKKDMAGIEQELSKIKPVNIKELKDIDQRSADISKKDSELRIRLNDLKNQEKLVNDEITGLNAKIESNRKAKEEAAETIKKLNTEIEDLEKKIKVAKKSTSNLYGERQKLEEKRMELEKAKLERYQRFGSYSEDLKNRRTSLIGLEHEIEEGSAKLKEFDVEPDLGTDLEARLSETIDALSTMGPVNLKAAQEYDETDKEVREMIDKKDKLKDEKKAVIRFVRDIERNKKEAFMSIYNKTAKHFKEVFSELLDGKALLGLENAEDPFDGGLFIESKMHGKSIRLEAMSGGEKSLTALAFIFALQIHAPSPFYLFDEIDAALDKINSEKLVNKLKAMGKTSQVLIITHNDQILKACDQLIGVYMKEGISEIVSVKVD